MIKAVVFDIGHIIYKVRGIQTIKALKIEQLFPNDNQVPNNKQVPNDAQVYFSNWNKYIQYEKGEISTPQFLIEVNKKFNLNLSLSDFVSAWQAMVTGFVDGMPELLKKVSKKYPLYALSNINITHYDQLLPEIKALGAFADIFCSFMWGLRKPDPAIYKKLISSLNFEPTEILFIDDIEDNVASAQSCRIQAERCFESSEQVYQALKKHGVSI